MGTTLHCKRVTTALLWTAREIPDVSCASSRARSGQPVLPVYWRTMSG